MAVAPKWTDEDVAKELRKEPIRELFRLRAAVFDASFKAVSANSASYLTTAGSGSPSDARHAELIAWLAEVTATLKRLKEICP